MELVDDWKGFRTFFKLSLLVRSWTSWSWTQRDKYLMEYTSVQVKPFVGKISERGWIRVNHIRLCSNICSSVAGNLFKLLQIHRHSPLPSRSPLSQYPSICPCLITNLCRGSCPLIKSVSYSSLRDIKSWQKGRKSTLFISLANLTSLKYWKFVCQMLPDDVYFDI